jgi:hypothetical protein
MLLPACLFTETSARKKAARVYFSHRESKLQGNSRSPTSQLFFPPDWLTDEWRFSCILKRHLPGYHNVLPSIYNVCAEAAGVLLTRKESLLTDSICWGGFISKYTNVM